MNLRLALDRFNRGRKQPLTVTRDRDRFTFEIRGRFLGYIEMMYNASNCGVLDLHHLFADKKKDRDLILDFVKIFAKVSHRSILLYNSASYQRGVKNSLRDAKFYTMGKSFYNSNSEERAQFHACQL
jgi:hypothetical protein